MVVMDGFISLENLESCQDEWERNCCSATHSSPHSAGNDTGPPQLNSPRSLHACKLCNVDSSVVLAPVSLRQHFEYLQGNPQLVSQKFAVDVPMRDALLACIEAGITGGSSLLKLQAYRRYMDHVKARKEALKMAQEARQRLITQETVETGRQTLREGDATLSPKIPQEQNRSNTATSTVALKNACDSMGGDSPEEEANNSDNNDESGEKPQQHHERARGQKVSADSPHLADNAGSSSLVREPDNGGSSAAAMRQERRNSSLNQSVCITGQHGGEQHDTAKGGKGDSCIPHQCGKPVISLPHVESMRNGAGSKAVGREVGEIRSRDPSSACESEEVFYVYCANATASGEEA
ncbi:hypothetical protein, conserved [Trypanosoma brucei gambiense DAL972]|uniref:Uncharacterized protein n=2 Tax=Trypanosoma brucei TaxID=5691 RepID=C9ZM58_TRYB9|nr:hypothetical protein, conserved [Trypanosoma brucei gambiense DAL972]CBH10483.1 hypothetical protein, conserved [Trypanosoma brucei gambiense DAL972]|eukprot:XP_011772773.1 hypothetical protein, conserved [Trypanosoma brucei gambiense DAL972]